MNKKFSTLVASLLLAGGMATPAFADSFKTVIEDAGYSAEQYYRVRVRPNEKPTVSDQWLDVNHANHCSLETDKSTLWTVKKVTAQSNGKDQLIGVQLISVLTGEPLSVTVKEGNKKVTYSTFYAGGLEGANPALLFEEGKGYKGADNALESTPANIWWYDLEKVEPSALNKTQLEALQGDRTGIQIGYYEKKSGDKAEKWYEYTQFEGGNVFGGDLFVGEGTPEGGYTLFTDKKMTQQIVLLNEKWDAFSSQSGEGNKFAVWKKADVLKDAAKLSNKKVLATKFRISAPATVAGDPLEVVAIDESTNKYEVVVAVIKKADGTKVNRLTVKPGSTENVADYTKAASNGADNTYIKLGVSNAVDNDDFIGKIWEIRQGDQIATPKCGAVDFVSAAQVATGFPEGQWLWDDETEMFVNRESGKTLELNGLRYTDKDGVYTYGDATVSIQAVGTPGVSENGYLHGYTNDQLKQKAFFIGAPIKASEDTLYLSRGANGVLEFTKDKAEAVELRLTPEVLDNEGCQTIQIRNVYTAWKDKAKGVKEQKYDFTGFTQYNVTAAVTGEILAYDTKEERYVLATQDAIDKNINLEAAPEFLFKNKKENVYNIVFFEGFEHGESLSSLAPEHAYHYANANIFCNNAKKLLGAFNTSELVKVKNAYDLEQNDLFVVVDADAHQYRGDFSVASLDTIKIFRNDDNSYVLYEKGAMTTVKDEVVEGFLGMENFFDPQYAKKNPALLADTAFHANTYRPQYMLAVDAKIVDAENNLCDICNKPSCEHSNVTRGYVAGRYLVNLVDSAKAVTASPLKNKFTYEMYEANKPYYRLGFVQAKHEGDSLIIASTNDTIDLAINRPDYDKVCTFAFRYVDANRDAFTIETVYNYELDEYGDLNSYERGFMKFHNGIPVVTPKASEAWVFDLEVLHNQAPTANEEVAVSEVSVVAVNGAVVVKGAAGKTVAISNILGQTIANTVIASDNETIAVPAGIVVVAVEGEEAVKAIVR